MSCGKWDERVARWIDGEAIEGVEAHVEECAACRELAQGLRDDQVLLRAPVDVPVGLVRLRPRRMWWVPALAAAAMVAVWSTGVWLTVREPLPKQLAAVSALNIERVERVPRWREPRRAARPVTSRQIQALRELFADEERRARPARVAPAGEVAMQFATSNPDVVIVWLQESKGERQ